MNVDYSFPRPAGMAMRNSTVASNAPAHRRLEPSRGRRIAPALLAGVLFCSAGRLARRQNTRGCQGLAKLAGYRRIRGVL